jgi:hypothetical protein
LNGLLQMLQQNGSPICMRWWCFRRISSLNDFLHTLQQNRCSPLCMRWCSIRRFRLLNDLLHTLQLNDLLHMLQQNGFSSLCMCWCVFRWPWKLNHLLHTFQQNGCSTLYIRQCVFRISYLLNESPHSLQEYHHSSPHTGLRLKYSGKWEEIPWKILLGLGMSLKPQYGEMLNQLAWEGWRREGGKGRTPPCVVHDLVNQNVWWCLSE